jgi:hypothetical protein
MAGQGARRGEACLTEQRQYQIAAILAAPIGVPEDFDLQALVLAVFVKVFAERRDAKHKV